MAENCDFTAEEHLINQKRYDEGYDIQDNHRYNLWVETYSLYMRNRQVCNTLRINIFTLCIIIFVSIQLVLLGVREEAQQPHVIRMIIVSVLHLKITSMLFIMTTVGADASSRESSGMLQ